MVYILKNKIERLNCTSHRLDLLKGYRKSQIPPPKKEILDYFIFIVPRYGEIGEKLRRNITAVIVEGNVCNTAMQYGTNTKQNSR